jgi:hypothetical protein
MGSHPRPRKGKPMSFTLFVRLWFMAHGTALALSIGAIWSRAINEAYVERVASIFFN